MMAKKKMNSAGVRDEVLDVVARLPEGATFDDAIYALNVLRKIELGLADVAAGRTIPHEEAVAMVTERLRQLAERQVVPFDPPKENRPPEFQIQKEEVLENLRCLPQDVSIDEVIDRLYFLNRIARARTEIATGQTFTQEEVRARVLPWLH